MILNQKFFSLERKNSGYFNMNQDATNYVATHSMEQDDFKLRVYEWQSPTISLGISQGSYVDKVSREAGEDVKHQKNLFDQAKLQADNVEVVKRITGGKAVLHHEELTYSLACKLNHAHFGGSLHQSYQKIAIALTQFLIDVGIHPKRINVNTNKKTSNRQLRKTEICYALTGFSEIEVDGKKLIGSAQKRGKDGFLQHGSIPLYRKKYFIADYLMDEHNVLPQEKKTEQVALVDFLPSTVAQTIDNEHIKQTLALAFYKVAHPYALCYDKKLNTTTS